MSTAFRNPGGAEELPPNRVHDTLGRHILADGFDLVLDLDKSSGLRLVDQRDGTTYLDMFGFFASSALGMNHPDLVGDPDSGERSVNRWFNTSAFAQPAFGALGNLGRNTERGPGVNNLDLAVFKNFSFGRELRLQFRLESFNVLNHTQFAGVSTNLTSSNFGVVTSARAARINQLGVKLIF